jgi:hypothetical protein
VLPFAVLWIPWSSCHSCPFVSPPFFLVRAHVVILVIKSIVLITHIPTGTRLWWFTRSLRSESYVRLQHFVRRSTYVPFWRFWGDVGREFMQRLFATLHGTLGTYLRDALQEGSGGAMAYLPVPRACVFPLFLVLLSGLHCVLWYEVILIYSSVMCNSMYTHPIHTDRFCICTGIIGTLTLRKINIKNTKYRVLPHWRRLSVGGGL